MRVIIALIVWTLSLMLPSNVAVSDPVIIPPMPQYSPAVIEEQEWTEYHSDAVKEYEDEFTALFNSYEIKRAKNNALMIRRGNSGSYKFAKKG